MKLTFLKNVKSVLFLASGFVFMVTSCSKLEESNSVQDDSVPNKDVFANFNWATSKTVTVHVPVDDEFEGNFFYKLEIFDREPHLEGAVLLGGGMAKKGQDLLAKITIPSGLSHVFVQKTTPTGEVSYSILDINSSTKVITSKVASINPSNLNKLSSTTPISPNPPAVPSVPKDALTISGNDIVSNVPSSKAFYIPEGVRFAGNIPALNQAGADGLVVYVRGKWHHNADVNYNINLNGNTRVVILPGGELNVAALNFNGGAASLVNHGDVLLKSMKMTDNNSFKNVGTLRIQGLVSMVKNTEFVNYQKDVKVKIDALTMDNENCVVTNNGELEILEGTFKNGTLNANCYTTVGKMETSNATVNIWSDAMLDVTNLNSVGGTYNLYSRAVLDVTRVATFGADAGLKPVVINTIGAEATRKSYVRVKYLRVKDNSKVHLAYNGYIGVITDEHPNKRDNSFTVNGSSVEIFWDLYNHPPYHAASSCATGGNGSTKPTEPTNPPVDQELKKVELGAHTFLFEDNWPIAGDYDLNDLVLQVDVVKYQNKSNKIEKLVLKNTIYASGAARAMAAGVQLDNVLAGAVKSVVYSNKANDNSPVMKLNSLGIEQDQSKAVLAIADRVHSAFGLSSAGFIFTHNGAFKPFVNEITIEFNTPQEDFTFSDLNPFIINPYQGLSGKRFETHLVGYHGTDKMDMVSAANQQSSGGSLSSTDPFKLRNGWPFAISLPKAKFKYQETEGKGIEDAYPKFIDWANSGGATNQDWYNFPK